MPPPVRSAKVIDGDAHAARAAGLFDTVERPGHRSPSILVRGPSVVVHRALRFAHIKCQWRSQEQAYYVTDKQLQDLKYASFEVEKGLDESAYDAGQNLIARCRVLILQVGVATSKSAGPAVLEAIHTRVQAGKDIWLVSADEMPLEKAAVYSPEVALALTRFRLAQLGAPNLDTVPAAVPLSATSALHTTKAKYDGTCTKCSGTFRAGEEVAWTGPPPGGKRVHPRCAVR